MTSLTQDQISKLKPRSLADKYKVSKAYADMIIRGKRRASTPRAKAIMLDARRILTILEAPVDLNELKKSNNV